MNYTGNNIMQDYYKHASDVEDILGNNYIAYDIVDFGDDFVKVEVSGEWWDDHAYADGLVGNYLGGVCTDISDIHDIDEDNYLAVHTYKFAKEE